MQLGQRKAQRQAEEEAKKEADAKRREEKRRLEQQESEEMAAAKKDKTGSVPKLTRIQIQEQIEKQQRIGEREFVCASLLFIPQSLQGLSASLSVL
jgi:phage/plasmid primase-like uncharacterized protein